MERGSDKHGARLDDQLRKETRGVVQGRHDPRAEEWKSAEPSGEDQPIVDLTAEQDEQDARAELASLLGRDIWPASGALIRSRLRDAQAPDQLREWCQALPDGRVYDNVAEVWVDLTGHREAHRF